METSINNTEIIIQRYIETLYQAHNAHHLAGQTMTEHYGEVLTPSISQLIKIMSLTPEDVFLDMGSGTGKISLQVFLESSVATSIGIEINPKMHEVAVHLRAQVQVQFPEFFFARELQFVSGDFLTTIFQDVSVCLINATCFSQTLLQKITGVLNNMNRLRMVLSMRPLFDLEKLHYRFSHRIEGSWDSALCYIYAL